MPRPGEVKISDASLDVRAGEIVGIAGLVGCGKSELAQSCFGLREVTSGEIEVCGKTVRFSNPSEAIKSGLWYCPSDRKNDGLVMNRSVRENVALSSYAFGDLKSKWVNKGKETEVLQSLSERMSIDVNKYDEPVASLSGGNQQKVLLAKSLVQEIDIFVLDEPTVGVDIGACMSIYDHLSELSLAGAAILLVSSNLPELMGLTHRMLVMSEGKIVAEFKNNEYSEEQILENFF